MSEILTVAEAGRRGGKARARNLTPDQLREIGRRGHIARAVSVIEREARELTEVQKDRVLDAILGLDDAA